MSKTYQQWFDWRIKTTGQHIFPANGFEENVSFDCFGIAWAGAETLRNLSFH